MLCLLLAACGEAQAPAPEIRTDTAAPPSSLDVAAPADAGTLLDANYIGELSIADLDRTVAASSVAGLAGGARCDVTITAIRYATVGPDASPTTASAALMTPFGPACPRASHLIAYTRGTDLDLLATMATLEGFEPRIVAALLAGQGWPVVATDYLGYAESAFPRHPYLHADSEATANIDAIRAARAALATGGLPVSAEVLLTGYSQGGHASMATQRYLARSARGGIGVAAAAHLSGPYALEESVVSALDRLPVGDIGSTLFVPFTVTSLHAVYGDLYASPAEFFEAPYADTIEGLLPNRASIEELILQRKLPLLLSSLITPSFEQAARDPGSALRRALRANSPFDFVPMRPTMLCGGRRDPVVGFGNTRRAAEAFAAAAAPVSIVDVEEVAAFDSALPDTLDLLEVLSDYHARVVPPLCLLRAREQVFAGLR